ncbi:helix-turn-helix domain-containing protein [Candidatus Entotheonella palauensis]|uniref:helix-turn-helix domain-containing protein n=1 Tax=Candidatus Entotheonella palauensis TaxID=93172 RepID=UPI0004ADEB09|nr:helix-turn-helix domain-containing protein [Candidatus Entotheonella palauensis]
MKNLTVPEAAARLGISERAAWQRIYRGQLPHRRWGRRVIIPLDDLEAFIKALPGCSVEEALDEINDGRR